MTAVVVTGTGVVCSIAADLVEFATALRAGNCGINSRAETVSDPMRPWLAADLPEWDFARRLIESSWSPALHPAMPEIARRAAGRAPVGVQLSVVVAMQAWAQARLAVHPVDAERVAVIVAGHNLNGGSAAIAAERHARSPAHLSPRYALQFMDTDHVATVSEVLGVRGEGCTVGGASASGNVAIVNACRMIAVEAADVCLVIGAMSDLSEAERQAFYNLGVMAGAVSRSDPLGRCRPFDAQREGFVPGAGAACLVLESAASAARRGVEALARIAGSAVGLDGNSLADPTVAGEVSVMRRALTRARLRPGQVDYVNAHATASVLGDVVELAALDEVFGASGRPWVNSTKGLTGHCLSAAGLVEAVATLVQLREGFVHPNRNLEPLASRCRLAGISAAPARLRVAMSNGFGFGGFNSSVVFTAVA
jgi:malonyl-ACP decarboxylase